jgi:hypothetical protein
MKQIINPAELDLKEKVISINRVAKVEKAAETSVSAVWS